MWCSFCEIFIKRFSRLFHVTLNLPPTAVLCFFKGLWIDQTNTAKPSDPTGSATTCADLTATAFDLYGF